MIPQHLANKKLVMSPEIFCSEMTKSLMELYKAFKDFPPMEEHVARKVFREISEGHLLLIWEENVDSKSDDPEVFPA